MKKKNILFKFILISFISLGIITSFINFLNFRSLWLDEAMLALNIINKTSLNLLKPLEMGQVAPIGFLLLQKLLCILLGNKDWVLRVIPLVSFLTSIPLFYFLNLKITPKKTLALYSTAFFSLSWILIYYSSEVKQYMLDVLFSILITYYTLIFLTSRKKKHLYIYTIIGMTSIWFSNISIIILFTVGLYILYNIKNNNRNYLDAITPIILWSTSFITYYLLFIHNHPTKKFMLEYWESSFLPSNILSIDFYISLFTKIKELIYLLGYNTHPLLVIIPLTVIPSGIIYLFFNNRKYLYLCTFPIITHLSLSYLKLYPFSIRLILYLTPLLIILFTSGAYHIYTIIKTKYSKTSFYILLIPLLILLLTIFKSTPIQKEEIKLSLNYINKKNTPNENIYIYYGAKPAFLFYKKDYQCFNKNNIILGTSNRSNWDQYNNEIKNLTNINWIVFSHTYWVKNKSALTEEEYIIKTFKKNGYQIIEQKHFEGSSVYKVNPSKKHK